MFELEDYDLDDEVFLSTQMPTGIEESTVNSSGITLNFKENDKPYHNVSNSVKISESIPSKNIEERNKSSEIAKLVNDSQSNQIKLHFDDEFDSDDEAFFNTPDILYEPINSLNSSHNSSTSEFSLMKDYESVSSTNSECYNSTFKSPNIKSSNKQNYNSSLNTTVTSIKAMTTKCASRKFPGPAGLLSENEDMYSEDPSTLESLESLDMSIIINENDKKEENLCTQVNDLSFSSSPYQQFLTDFVNTDIDVLLDKFNVAWIKLKLLPYTASGRFFTDKIPFFVSVIKEIDCLSPDPTVLLADKTGHIRGTIHRAVWNQFGTQLKLGTVLVLSKVGVSCQKIVKGFTMNITSDHLIAIYSSSSEDLQEVIVTRTTNLINEEIVSNAKRWNVCNTEILCEHPHSETRSRINAINNLKLYDFSFNQNSQRSNANSQTASNTPTQSTLVKPLFKLKTPVAQNLLKSYSHNLSEEPPTKRLRNEENQLGAKEKDSNNDLSIVKSIFEGIDENEMFDDFC